MLRATRLATIHGVKDPPIVLLDHLVGIRAWGLVLYATLPANLALIGALKVEVKGTGDGWPALALLVLPVVATFLLIRSRQREWYLSPLLLNSRSLIMTLLILFFSSTIYAGAQILTGHYVFTLAEPFGAAQFTTIRESIFFGVACLVASSTLFMTLLTKDSNLPGLPRSDAGTSLAAVRSGLRLLQDHAIWREYRAPCADATNLVTDFLSALKNTKDLGFPEFSYGSLKHLELMANDFASTVRDLQSAGNDDGRATIWKTYFAPATDLSQDELAERQHHLTRFQSLQSLFNTTWDR